MADADPDRPLYPNEGAFMVKLRRGAGCGERCAGQIEHVHSGRAHRFSNTEELLNFIYRMMRSADPPDPTGGASADDLVRF